MSQCFLVTRPEPQAIPLAKRIEQCGANAVILPSIVIEPLPYTLPNPNAAHLIAIVTSRNAVTTQLLQCPPDTQFIAVGPATQKYLTDIGIEASVPTTFNSSGILRLPPLQGPKNTAVWIFTGESPKPQLQTTLIARGFTVRMCYCYRRIRPSVDASATLSMLQQHEFDAIISASIASLENLFEMLGTAGKDWLIAQTWCVVSEDMRNVATAKGIKRIILAQNPTETAILNALNLVE